LSEVSVLSDNPKTTQALTDEIAINPRTDTKKFSIPKGARDFPRARFFFLVVIGITSYKSLRNRLWSYSKYFKIHTISLPWGEFGEFDT
jgi:hypothetical protein